MWRRFGRLPSVGVLSAVFALIGLAWLAAPARTALLASATTLLVLYCLARPRGGWDAFGSAILPGGVASLLHAVAGTPRWIGALLIPVALVVAWDDDRERAAQRE
jgi:hypothetical protein